MKLINRALHHIGAVCSRETGQVVHSPVFIIGAPRTGSTILYQALTNAFDIAYIDNTACRWHGSLLFAMWLSRRKHGGAPHNNFQSEYGNTKKFGGHAPSECGEFWYRWMPRDRHFLDHSDVRAEVVSAIRREVGQVSAYLNKPLLFKNLNAGQRLRFIRQAFPESKLIFVRRDPRFVLRSILQARASLGLERGQWWSIMPPHYDTLIALPEAEMCAAQIYFIEKQIIEDLALFPVHNTKTVTYNEFSSDLIDELAQWLGVPRRPGGEIPDFRRDDPSRLSVKEAETFSAALEKYNFAPELFV